MELPHGFGISGSDALSLLSVLFKAFEKGIPREGAEGELGPVSDNSNLAVPIATLLQTFRSADAIEA